jgi:large subunit ribosomal protein L21
MGFRIYIAPPEGSLKRLARAGLRAPALQAPIRTVKPMFAVIRTGGKQYRVAPNDIIEVEKIAGQPGDIVELSEVLLLGGDSPKTGSPTIAGALVAAEVIAQKRDDKIIVFKKKRRKNYRRTKGHRQALTALRITEILTDGKKPSKQAAKPEPKKTEKKPAVKAEAAKPEARAKPKQETKKPAAKKAAAKPAAKKPAAKAAAKKPATKPKKR